VTTTSRFGAVTDALITLIGATDVSATFDGPFLTADIPIDYAIVGGTDDPEDDGGEFTQDWNGLGARTKVETGEVVCAILVGTGDDVVKVARDRALDIVGQVETAIRADPTLGGAVVSGWCQVSRGVPRQRTNTAGLYVRIVLTIAYQSHI
jgi:hypothetical protein